MNRNDYLSFRNILSVIIVGAVLLFFILQYSQIPEGLGQLPRQVSNTTTLMDFVLYKNDTYGIEFQSPSKWNKVEKSGTIEFISPDDGTRSWLRPSISVSVQSVADINVTTLEDYSKLIDKWYDERIKDYACGGGSSDRPNATFAGMPAMEKKYWCYTGDVLELIFTIKSNKVYVVTYSAREPIPDYSYIYDEIVSSFRIFA